MLNRLAFALSAIVIAITLSACSTQPPQVSFTPASGNVSHVVVCYLKTPGDPAARQKLIEASRQFKSIPGVLGVAVGQVLPSTRPIVVSDYDVALVITAKDIAAINAYVAHPLHQKAVKEILAPLTSKIVVYDFVNE